RLLCKREWIEEALQHVLDNDGSQTAGIDGISWKTFNDADKDDFENEKFKQQFIDTLQAELKNRTFKPMPVRRVEIPKPGTNKKRPLGIPIVRSYCPPYRVLSGFVASDGSDLPTHAHAPTFTVPYFPQAETFVVVSNGAGSAA